MFSSTMFRLCLGVAVLGLLTLTFAGAQSAVPSPTQLALDHAAKKETYMPASCSGSRKTPPPRRCVRPCRRSSANPTIGRRVDVQTTAAAEKAVVDRFGVSGHRFRWSWRSLLTGPSRGLPSER